jgi:hypothetical protein
VLQPIHTAADWDYCNITIFFHFFRLPCYRNKRVQTLEVFRMFWKNNSLHDCFLLQMSWFITMSSTSMTQLGHDVLQWLTWISAAPLYTGRDIQKCLYCCSSSVQDLYKVKIAICLTLHRACTWHAPSCFNWKKLLQTYSDLNSRISGSSIVVTRCILCSVVKKSSITRHLHNKQFWLFTSWRNRLLTSH